MQDLDIDEILHAGRRSFRLQVPVVPTTRDPEDAAAFGGHVANLRDGCLEEIEALVPAAVRCA